MEEKIVYTVESPCPTCGHFEKAKKVSGGNVGPRGPKNSTPVTEMTDDELKTEIINAGSVHYKAVKRGAPEATIAHNEVRLNAAKAEREARKAAEPQVVEVIDPNANLSIE